MILANRQFLTSGALLISSCQPAISEKKVTSAAPVESVATRTLAIKAATAQAKVVAQHFGPIINGVWVNAEYLALVQSSKSPLKSFDATGQISEIHINIKAQVGDSLVAGLGLGNHEGGDMAIYFQPGQQATSLPTSFRDYDSPGSFAELSYRLGSRDTALLLTTYNKNRKVIAQASYQRIQGASMDELDALNQAVNKLLFVGTYTGTDSLNQPVQAQFTANGQVKGLKGFQQYYTATDFGSGPGNDIDHLVLDSNTKHEKLMGYSHRVDTLRLYAANLMEKESSPGTQDTVATLVKGRLQFTLIRR